MTTQTAMNNDTPKTTLMDIDPQTAAKWLEGNIRNRRIDQKHVDVLAKEMAAGRWVLTHQGIAFDANGTLIDGQHRLWAILQSGCTIRIPVVTGLPADCIEAIDGMKSRTVIDRMTLSGAFGTEGVNTHHASALRDAVRGLDSGSRLSYNELTDLMTQHVDAVRFATAHVSTRVRGIGVSYVRAVIVRAWYSVDHDDLTRFCRVLSSGMPEFNNDAIIIKLRDQLMATGSTRNVTLQRELYGKVERVLMTWLKGETRSVLRPVKQEFFPLPKEVQC